MKTVLTTYGEGFRNAQLRELPQQVENVLANIAMDEASRINQYALAHIGTLEKEGQVSCLFHLPIVTSWYESCKC